MSKIKHLILQTLCYILVFVSLLTLIITVIYAVMVGGTGIIAVIMISAFALACIGMMLSDYVQRKFDTEQYKHRFWKLDN